MQPQSRYDQDRKSREGTLQHERQPLLLLLLLDLSEDPLFAVHSQVSSQSEKHKAYNDCKGDLHLSNFRQKKHRDHATPTLQWCTAEWCSQTLTQLCCHYTDSIVIFIRRWGALPPSTSTSRAALALTVVAEFVRCCRCFKSCFFYSCWPWSGPQQRQRHLLAWGSLSGWSTTWRHSARKRLAGPCTCIVHD